MCRHAPDRSLPRYGRYRLLPLLLRMLPRVPYIGARVGNFAVSSRQIADLASQMLGRIRQHRFEHRLQIEGRAADDLEHVGGRGLLLQVEVVVRSSLSRRVFSMAITAWAAKFCTSSICFSVNGRTSWR